MLMNSLRGIQLLDALAHCALNIKSFWAALKPQTYIKSRDHIVKAVLVHSRGHMNIEAIARQKVTQGATIAVKATIPLRSKLRLHF